MILRHSEKKLKSSSEIPVLRLWIFLFLARSLKIVFAAEARVRDLVESKVLVALHQNVVSNPDVVRYATDRYNRLVRDNLRKSPTRRKELESEERRLTTEIRRLVDFITQANAPDIEAVRQALREREVQKLKVMDELRYLAHADERKLLVTPHLV